jgi:hypothetical protein
MVFLFFQQFKNQVIVPMISTPENLSSFRFLKLIS